MSSERPLNFLLTTWEGGGSVGPMLTVARKLCDRGHSVRVMSDRCNRAEAEATGARFVPWTRAPSRLDRSRDSDLLRDWEAASPPETIQRVLDGIMTGPSLDYAQDLIAELEREPADLVVSSEILFGVGVGCEAIGQKHVILTANISLFEIPGVPPLGPGLLPAESPEEEALHAEIAEANRQMMASGLPALNEARAFFALPALERIDEQLLAAERVLLGTARAFDFAPEELPPHVRYVGPQLDDPTWADSWSSPWDAADDRPLVLVGFSTSFQDHVGVLQRIIDAAADLPVRLLVTLGGPIRPDELRAHGNSCIVDTAPHNVVMPHASLVITHGGHGTVARSLIYRKPMILVPHGRDQNDNAARVTARGAGLMLLATSSVGEFRAAIAQVLNEPHFAAAAAKLGAQVAAEARQSPVVEELEKIAVTESRHRKLRAA